MKRPTRLDGAHIDVVSMCVCGLDEGEFAVTPLPVEAAKERHFKFGDLFSLHKYWEFLRSHRETFVLLRSINHVYYKTNLLQQKLADN